METWILVGILLFLIFLIYSSHCDCRRGFRVGGQDQSCKVGCSLGSMCPPGNLVCPSNTGCCDIYCNNELNKICSPSRAKSVGDCFKGTGDNQLSLRRAGCVQNIFNNWCNSPSPSGPPPSPPSPPPGPPSSNSCVNPEYKGLCIDNYSATLNPNDWFGEDAGKFNWPLTSQPIRVIRTYNWTHMKVWVLWALKNNIKVLIGTASFDFTSDPTSEEKQILLDYKENIIAISPVNEGSDPGPTFDFLDKIPIIACNKNGEGSTNDPPISGASNDIVAVNVYGLFFDMCCCDGPRQDYCDCTENKQEDTLKKQNNFNFDNIFIQSILNGIQKYTRYDAPNRPWGNKFWVTEYGWESQYSDKNKPTKGPNCSNPQKYINRKKAWSNVDNYKTTYTNFLNFNSSSVNSKLYYPIEYVFWFTLCDTNGEYFGLHDSSLLINGFPKLKF